MLGSPEPAGTRVLVPFRVPVELHQPLARGSRTQVPDCLVLAFPFPRVQCQLGTARVSWHNAVCNHSRVECFSMRSRLHSKATPHAPFVLISDSPLERHTTVCDRMVRSVPGLGHLSQPLLITRGERSQLCLGQLDGFTKRRSSTRQFVSCSTYQKFEVAANSASLTPVEANAATALPLPKTSSVPLSLYTSSASHQFPRMRDARSASAFTGARSSVPPRPRILVSRLLNQVPHWLSFQMLGPRPYSKMGENHG